MNTDKYKVFIKYTRNGIIQFKKYNGLTFSEKNPPKRLSTKKIYIFAPSLEKRH